MRQCEDEMSKMKCEARKRRRRERERWGKKLLYPPEYNIYSKKQIKEKKN